MQQVALFKTKRHKKFNKGNLNFQILEEKDSYYIWLLNIPSWSFIIKFSLEKNKIYDFQIIDYSWYLYITLSLIQNLKDLTQIIIDRINISK